MGCVHPHQVAYAEPGCLFDIGMAGPIAGFLVAVAVLAFALGMSQAARLAAIAGERIEVGYPLIFQLAHRMVALVAPVHSTARCR